MELLIQPDDGLKPIIKAIDRARKSVEVVIFRCDRKQIEEALAKAVQRGVFVHALIAHTNRKGEESLRALELRLLAAGVTVARTADDLVRYHSKFMIIDRETLYLLAFNFTYQDIHQSRSFGIVTEHPQIVQEALKLFEADTTRQDYSAGLNNFVVSPANSRAELKALIAKAKEQLLIYDPTISDPEMIRLLQDRVLAGVDVRIIGRVARKGAKLNVRPMPRMRLHTRTIIRDGRQAFVGSQSLRALELDARREAGIIFNDDKVVNRLQRIFHDDWELAEHAGAVEDAPEAVPASKVAKRVAKAVVKELPPVAPVIDGAVREVAGAVKKLDINFDEVEETVSEAVKDAVKEAVKNVVEDAVENTEKG